MSTVARDRSGCKSSGYLRSLVATEKARAALDATSARSSLALRSRNWFSVPAGVRRSGWTSIARKIGRFSDLAQFRAFEDEWLRGRPSQWWTSKDPPGKPTDVFETVDPPASRAAWRIHDFCTDYELFSETLPYDLEEEAPADAGPIRIRRRSTACCSTPGAGPCGICFCVDLDPRWVAQVDRRAGASTSKLNKSYMIDQVVMIERGP